MDQVFWRLGSVSFSNPLPNWGGLRVGDPLRFEPDGEAEVAQRKSMADPTADPRRVVQIILDTEPKPLGHPNGSQRTVLSLGN